MRLIGAYELNTVNGAALPAVLSLSGGDTTYLNSEVLTVRPGGTYQTYGTESRHHSSGGGSPFGVNSAGTYFANGSGYTFTDNTLGAGSGTLSRGTLTVNLAGAAFVFGVVQ